MKRKAMAIVLMAAMIYPPRDVISRRKKKAEIHPKQIFQTTTGRRMDT